MVDRGQNAVPVTPGMVLGGRWRIDALVGTGGMAEVFRATELASGRAVAVKVLRASLESSPEAIQRFRREGELLVRLKNAAIVGAEAIESLPDGRLFIVMELLEGETLGARLKRGTMTAAELAPIVAGCAVALSAAHAAGVVHRDLKPDNVFLARRPDGSMQVKLLDFGVSKVWNGEKLTQTGQVLGTPRYMSPEQLGAEPEVDHRVDLYSLGVILYEALSGRSPFLVSTPTDLIVAILNGKAVPLRSVRPDIPPALEAMVMRAMAKVRDARHRAATELAEAFFEAAGIDPRVMPARRHGMATSPLGAMRAEGGIVVEERVADAPGASLKVGTFSSFEAIDMDRVVAAQTAPAALAAALAPLVDPARAQAPTVAARPGLATTVPAGAIPPVGSEKAPAAASGREIPRTALSPIAVMPEPAVDASVRRDPSERMPRRDSTPYGPNETAPVAFPGRISRASSASVAGAHAPRSIPVEGARSPSGLVLIVVGLLAGALTAGVVVAVLTWASQMSGGEGHSPPPPPPPPGAPTSDAGAPADTGSPVDAGSSSTAAATGAIVPPPVVPEETPPETTATSSSGGSGSRSSSSSSSSSGSSGSSASSGSRRSGGSSGSGSSGGSHGTVVDEAIETARTPLEAARAAAAAGDFAECVDILDDAIASSRLPLAYRRRADCLMRLGDTRDAIRDYQTFCRGAPDSPGIGEVRDILAGMGATCP